MKSTPTYSTQKLVRDAYRQVWMQRLTDGLSYDDACNLYGNVAEILSNSIYCSDDDPGEWSRGGYVTMNFESGLPWCYYDDGLDVLFDLDDKVNALLAAYGSDIRVFNELQNAAVTCVYDS